MTTSGLLKVFVVLAVLQYYAVQMAGVPADLQCVGNTQNDGQIHYSLSHDISNKKIHDCEFQWLIKGKVTAIFDFNGHGNFTLPIKNATAYTARTENCLDSLEYSVISPASNVHKKLPCSCNSSGSSSSAKATLGPQAGNNTILEDKKDVRAAEKIVGVPLPTLQDIYATRLTRKALSIAGDPTHPSHCFFSLLPSGRRLWSLQAKTSRPKDSFIHQAVRKLNFLPSLPPLFCTMHH